jgi:tRNA A-37 threonylcarbamoyl transferase component Bud32
MIQTATTLGKYLLLERLGQGGMAQVYRARQPVIERNVAIKVLHPHLATQGDFVARFQREARGLGALRHPHIVSVIDFDAVGDSHYLVMDYIPGPTLAAVLAKQGRLPAMQALSIAEQIASALAYAHRQGAIHRDVKPGNILFLDETHTHAVLTDFGIAHLLGAPALTMSGAVAGTPAYMSPEAAESGAVDARSDLYSLGVVLYEMVTGETPYKGDTPVRMMMQHVTVPLPPLRTTHPDLPEIVVQLIERALAKEPQHRFPDAEAMRQAILQAQLALSGGQTPQTQLIPMTTLVAESAQGERPLALPSEPVSPPAAALVAPTPDQSERPSLRQVWAELAATLAVVALVAAGWLLFFQPTTAAQNIPPSEAGLGTVQIRPTPGGQEVTLTLSALPEPPADQHYHGWLRAREGVLYDLGALTVNQGAAQQIVAGAHDFLGTGEAAFVTLEETPQPPTPSAQVVLTGNVDKETATALQTLWIASELPVGKPLLPAGQAELALAQEHTTMLLDALTTDDLLMAQRHAEHVVNILDGESGALFGDLNLDGQAQNPGDGMGVRTYLAAAIDALTPLGDEATSIITALTHAQESTTAAMTLAQQASAADSVGEAQGVAEQLAVQIEQMVQGPNQTAGASGLLAVLEAIAALPIISLGPGSAQPK